MDRRQLKVYADTSVFGGVFDSEFSKSSKAFFDVVDAGKFDLVISAVVMAELIPAPVEVRNLLGKYAEKATIVEVSEQSEALQSDYIKQNVVGERAIADALHVAIATVSDCSFIVSWNFKDIVNHKSITGFNEVNRMHSYSQIGICSPQEVIRHVSA